MTHVTCRLTATNRDRLWNRTLGNRVWATCFNCISKFKVVANFPHIELLDLYYFAGTPIGSSHDMTTRWAGSAKVPAVPSRSHPVNRPSPTAGSHLPPPPSYQAATQSTVYDTSSPRQHATQRHVLDQHTPMTSPHVPLTSSLPASLLLAPAINRKMSFQLDSSTWRDREPTHFRWNMTAVGRTDNAPQREFHHKLPTCYDEV